MSPSSVGSRVVERSQEDHAAAVVAYNEAVAVREEAFGRMNAGAQLSDEDAVVLMQAAPVAPAPWGSDCDVEQEKAVEASREFEEKLKAWEDARAQVRLRGCVFLGASFCCGW